MAGCSHAETGRSTQVYILVYLYVHFTSVHIQSIITVYAAGVSGGTVVKSRTLDPEL